MNKFFGWLIAIFAIIVLLACLYAPAHFSRHQYDVVVMDKERVVKRAGDSLTSKYLIFTHTIEGEIRVFENTDSFWEIFWTGCKFNSSDIYADIEVGKRYYFWVYGWRVPFLSWYENIVQYDAYYD